MKSYKPIIKLGEAEIRALKHLSDSIINKIDPIIEITRGRKNSSASKKDGGDLYPFDKRLSAIKEIFKGKNVTFDLTSDESLLNNQILQLYAPDNGYQNWITFLCQLKKDGVFKHITPCLIVNGTDSDFEKNIDMQAQKLIAEFGTFIYRNSIIDENCYSDLSLFNSISDKIEILIDCDYVVQSLRTEVINKVISRIENLNNLCNNKVKGFIVSATSFPKNISEIGNDVSDEFTLSEVDIYNNVAKKFPCIEYSDYASINPVRNDNVIMARGWIPRIDVPLQDKIYYIRQRRPNGISKYASTYSAVARQIIQTKDFPQLNNNWGITQIRECANGAAPSSSPSFWISVRMCIHIEQQCNRIYST